MNLQDYVFTEDMSFDQFLDANPNADNKLEEDEDISQAVMDYYELIARANKAEEPEDPWDGGQEHMGD